MCTPFAHPFFLEKSAWLTALETITSLPHRSSSSSGFPVPALMCLGSWGGRKGLPAHSGLHLLPGQGKNCSTSCNSKIALLWKCTLLLQKNQFGAFTVRTGEPCHSLSPPAGAQRSGCRSSSLTPHSSLPASLIGKVPPKIPTIKPWAQWCYVPILPLSPVLSYATGKMSANPYSVQLHSYSTFWSEQQSLP